jgi:hypothetical protein
LARRIRSADILAKVPIVVIAFIGVGIVVVVAWFASRDGGVAWDGAAQTIVEFLKSLFH